MSTGHAWPGLVPVHPLPPDKVAVSATGSRVRFADGDERLCGTSGLWNVNLGHGHPAVVEAVVDAARSASFLSTFRFSHELVEEASRVLLEQLHPRFTRVAWCGSGASAVEAAVKLSRQSHALRGQERRRLVLSLVGSYHGNSFGAAAVTGENVLQRLYGVDQREFRHLPVEDAASLVDLLERQRDRIACIVVEPVLGSGTVPLPRAVLEALSTAQELGVHVVADEVATGFGRTGPLFAHHQWRLVPDIVLLSKGLTNGAVPGAAVAVADTIVETFRSSDAILLHAETGGGHPLTAAAVIAVVAQFRRPEVLAAGRALGDRLVALLDDVVATAPVAARHQGAGCFRTLTWRLRDGAAPDAALVTRVVDEARWRGVVIHPGPGGVQFVPNLLMSHDDLEALVRTSADVAWQHAGEPVLSR